MTNFSSLRVAFSGVLLAGGMAAASSASALVLDTSDNKANATLQLSTSAKNLLSNSAINLSARGNATSSNGSTFVLPVTEANISVGFFKLTPISGEAMGSAIAITKSGNTKLVGIGNFSLDFSNNTVYSDVFVNGQTTNMGLFTFNEKTDLKLGLSLSGGLTLYNTLDNLKLTTAGKDTFASALNLSAGLADQFAALNWGTIQVNITSALRKPPVSTTPFTAAMLVPEASTYAMMGLGLAGIGFVARRKTRAA